MTRLAEELSMIYDDEGWLIIMQEKERQASPNEE